MHTHMYAYTHTKQPITPPPNQSVYMYESFPLKFITLYGFLKKKKSNKTYLGLTAGYGPRDTWALQVDVPARALSSMF